MTIAVKLITCGLPGALSMIFNIAVCAVL
jgi:hypothetical protein